MEIKSVNKISLHYQIVFENGQHFEFDVVFDNGIWVLQGEDRARYMANELKEIYLILKKLNQELDI